MKLKNICAIYYPEHDKLDDLKYYLSSHAYRGLISPLHTPDNDELKPHHHILICLSSPREDGSLNLEFGKFGVTQFQRVGSVNSYSRYCFHLDNPEKQQFEGLSEGYAFGGFDIPKMIFRSVQSSDYIDVFTQIDELISRCKIPCNSDYSDVLASACSLGKSDIVDFMVNHAYACRCYIEGRKFAIKSNLNIK